MSGVSGAPCRAAEQDAAWQAVADRLALTLADYLDGRNTPTRQKNAIDALLAYNDLKAENDP